MKPPKNDWQRFLLEKITEGSEIGDIVKQIHESYDSEIRLSEVLNFIKSRGGIEKILSESIPTTIDMEDIHEVIKKSSLNDHLFYFSLTETEGKIEYPDTDFYFTWKNDTDGYYLLAWNPYVDQQEKKVKEPLSWLESWLTLLEQRIPSDSTKKEKTKVVEKIDQELSESKKQLIALSDEVLLFLIDRKKVDPTLTFWLRTVNNDSRLTNGQWFQGADYIFVGFSNIGTPNMTQSIGFVIIFPENEKPRFYIEIVFGYAEQKKHVKCYEEIVSYLNTEFSEKREYKRKIFFDYVELNWKIALDIFISIHKLQIDAIIESHGLTSDFAIPETNFQITLTKTMKIRKALGRPPIAPIASVTPDYEIVTDNPAEKDALDRMDFMKILHDKIESLWENTGNKESYTILLNGEWGSGKSSMLIYLRNFLQDSQWKVVEYNAWKHQHLPDQWWILINKVSKCLSGANREPNDANQSTSHRFWSFKIRNNHTLIVLVLIAVFLGSGYGLADSLFFGGNNGDDVKFYGSLVGVLGSIWVTFSGMVQNVFKRKVSLADLAKTNTSDPYEPIKKRFNAITAHRKVAIFIDDMDRCEIEPTIELLEGIQNLFKETKVLYVIAADRNWISNCFDKKYEEFKDLQKEGHSIGNQFLQKAFQMIVDVPIMSDEKQKELWGSYLGIKEEQQKQVKEPIVSTTTKSGDKEEIPSQNPTAPKQESAASIKAREFEKATLERNKKTQLMNKFVALGSKNPRAMTLLINQYIIKYQSLIFADNDKEVNQDAMVRYVVFSANYPDYERQIKQGKSTLEKFCKSNAQLDKLVEKVLTTQMIREYL